MDKKSEELADKKRDELINQALSENISSKNAACSGCSCSSRCGGKCAQPPCAYCG
ncbi:hypothetical protein [Aliikangiella coralliicola]|uniref:hypothetical protein n=1 Tax=Aliikangiella coralliicola TaxID=2592383 RepID=UPI00143D11DC|nr:hypothetical protein [Aliikangiella coralliicola]